jgi:hypothetical protein
MTKDVHNGLRQMSISHTANEIIARQIRRSALPKADDGKNRAAIAAEADSCGD